jgi:hypothetical protein
MPEGGSSWPRNGSGISAQLSCAIKVRGRPFRCGQAKSGGRSGSPPSREVPGVLSSGDRFTVLSAGRAQALSGRLNRESPCRERSTSRESGTASIAVYSKIVKWLNEVAEAAEQQRPWDWRNERATARRKGPRIAHWKHHCSLLPLRPPVQTPSRIQVHRNRWIETSPVPEIS